MRTSELDKALECMHEVAFIKGQYDQAKREIERLQGLVDRLTSERGEPGNWNSTWSVERHLSWLTNRIEMMESVLGERDQEIERLKAGTNDD